MSGLELLVMIQAFLIICLNARANRADERTVEIATCIKTLWTYVTPADDEQDDPPGLAS